MFNFDLLIANIFLREEFTEYGISSSGRIENLYVEFNEEIELKMSVAHYAYVSIICLIPLLKF